mmetsp:Transcript_64714/g.124829  ORF Transcript_64714/g.124829 Transcript_64714/m.124829 type:complete len:513 (-) Transcript_64714:46-1584(-)
MDPAVDGGGKVTEYFCLARDELCPADADHGEHQAAIAAAGTGSTDANADVTGTRGSSCSFVAKCTDAGIAVHVMWLVWSLAFAAATACWGMRASMQSQMEALQQELQRIEERNTLRNQELALTAAGCVTGVRHAAHGILDLVRADGSSAGNFQLSTAVAPSTSAVVGTNLAPAASTSAKLPGVPVQLMRPLERRPQLPLAQVGFGIQNGGGGQQQSPASALWPTAASPPAVSKPAGAKGGVADPLAKTKEKFPEFMLCDVEWQDVKTMAQNQFGTWKAGVVREDATSMRALLDHAVERVQGVQNVPGVTNECGMGRLSMSVLAVLNVDSQHSLHGEPLVHAPLLTVLLDIPWSVTVWSGWPLFALLAQMHLHTHGADDMPVAGGRHAHYFRGLQEALVQQRPDLLSRRGAQFLEQTPGQQQQQQGAVPAHNGGAMVGEAGGMHAMPILCALASQLLGADVQRRKEAEQALQQVQAFYRQSVQSIEDLHASIVSAWPLYGILHTASLQLSMNT